MYFKRYQPLSWGSCLLLTVPAMIYTFNIFPCKGSILRRIKGCLVPFSCNFSIRNSYLPLYTSNHFWKMLYLWITGDYSVLAHNSIFFYVVFILSPVFFVNSSAIHSPIYEVGDIRFFAANVEILLEYLNLASQLASFLSKVDKRPSHSDLLT